MEARRGCVDRGAAFFFNAVMWTCGLVALYCFGRVVVAFVVRELGLP